MSCFRLRAAARGAAPELRSNRTGCGPDTGAGAGVERSRPVVNRHTRTARACASARREPRTRKSVHFIHGGKDSTSIPRPAARTRTSPGDPGHP